MPNPHERVNTNAPGARAKRMAVLRAALARKLAEKQGRNPEMSRVGRALSLAGGAKPRYGHESMRAKTPKGLPRTRMP